MYVWVHAKCSGPTPSPHPTPTPSSDQNSDDSTFNILQLNANGIGNKLTELGVVMENNKAKVAVIQELKRTPKSKKNYSPRGQGGGLLIFIHRSVTFSKQPSSVESLYDPHLEERSIEAEIGNMKLIISNIDITPASSCSNGYQSSIFNLLTTQESLISRLAIQDQPIL